MSNRREILHESLRRARLLTGGDGPGRWQRFESNETWRRLRKIAERLARRITGRIEDAEDVAQAVLAAYGMMNDAVAIKNPEAWITQAAVNASINLVRSRSRVSPTDPSVFCQREQDRASNRPDEIDRLVGEILVAQLLALLPQQQRAVLKLKYGADLERATIATILRVTEETVKTHLRRGTAHLRSITNGPESEKTPEEEGLGNRNGAPQSKMARTARESDEEQR